MLNKVVIGIDTSNYTTSCAVCSLDGRILESYKQLLPVKEGENGLRQSDAVFAHVKNFQIISSQIKEKHAEYEIVAVGYSAKKQYKFLPSVHQQRKSQHPQQHLRRQSNR